ncbi:MAG: Ig domain-containing protein, partial [Clostridiales bacterium]|nr:Ig domain-containing protein [Clostridiales bacterium]
MKRLSLVIAAVLALALLCAPAIAQAAALPQATFAFASSSYAVQDGRTIATALKGLPDVPQGAVRYRTGNTKIARVDADGVVTGVKAGRTTVTAQLAYAGKTYVVSASVTVSATKIYASRTRLTLYVGDTYDLYGAMRPNPANLKVTWSNSRKSVVSMVPMGEYAQLTARAAGTAVITMKLPNGNSARCQVTVKRATVSIPSSRTMYVGQTYPLSPKIAQGSVRQEVTYFSGSGKIAAVSPSGLITGNSAGSTYVYARLTNGQTARCRVTVRTVKISLSSS